MADTTEHKKLKQLIEKVLKKDERLWNEDKTTLNETLLLDLIEKIDETIIDLLLNEKELREKFFVKIKDAYVFKTNDFRFFIEENKVDNSYTAYKNRIGLTDGKKFLKDTNDVVLDFPYKDCVLEGGQSTEEGMDTYFEYEEEKTKTVKGEKITEEAGYKEKQAKRKEIFFNSVLAHDEIDRLFDHKALTNWKRFTKDTVGAKDFLPVQEIKRDKDGTIKENLIIKGNNLLALHSLKKQFAGKVKLIYIDPPYNTGNDGFKYNDNFNHSTWLTFMKNRLEVARELMKDDGSIWISLDDEEVHYGKILCDEIFGRDNFIANIIWHSKYTTSNDAKYVSYQHENILFYAKSKKSFEIGGFDRTEKQNKSYINSDNDPKGEWKATPIHAKSGKLENNYTIEFPNGYTWTPPKGRYPRYSKQRLLEIYHEGGLYFNKNGGVDKKTYLSEVKQTITPGSVWSYEEVGHTHGNNEEIASILEKGAFNNPKGTKLLKKICKVANIESKDIVLDYHAGSGTTAHAVLESNKEDGGNRKFIMIEQMDYINTVTCPRVQKVMEKENIDESFIYFELAKWNETAKEKILACESLEELEAFFDEMYERYFLNYNLKIKEFKEKVLQEQNFRNLSLDEQKKMFIAMLDNNQMYVNKTEMADKKFGISKADQKLTEEFYTSEK
jgi:adenine-specific DNA-methyltransferase